MKKILLLVILALLAITVVQIALTRERTGQKTELAEQTQASADIGGQFTLTDPNGKIIHDTDFRGKIMLVYFGFTRCPDMCPTTVATMSKAMALLGAQADQVAPIFITVDPSYDTPDKLKEFVKSFDSRLTALTGTDEQIKQVSDEYKTYFSKSPLTAEEAKDAGSDYTVDHSGYIFMMGKDGKYLRLFPYTVSEQELAAAVKAAL